MKERAALKRGFGLRFRGGRVSKITVDASGHRWPDKDESTTAVIDAVVDSKFRDAIAD